MKILFFVATFPSISETFVLNQITKMIDEGHDVRIYSWGKGDDECNHKDIENYDLNSKTWYLPKEIPQQYVKRLFGILPDMSALVLKHGLSALHLLSPRYGHKAINLTQCYVALQFLYHDWHPDVIISHFGDNGLMMTAMRTSGIIDKKTKLYTFFHAHEICRMSVKQIAKFYGPMFNGYDTLLPISHYWEKKLIESGAMPSQVKVVHMGIDLQRFNFIPKIEIAGNLNILSVGRLVGQKGHEYAIQGVASYIKQTGRAVHYKIIGSGHMESQLKDMVRKLGAEDNIIFMGSQPQQVVTEEMMKANVFLLPSVTDEDGYMEGIPVALMEAMARGLVCISTYHSGIPELIENGKTGFLCTEKNSKEITQVLRKLEHLSKEEIETLRLNAHDKVRNEFNINKQINQLLCLFTPQIKHMNTSSFKTT